MDEFDKLVVRTHKAGLKVMIDFVPNHVAREYKSICKPEGIEDLGANDDKSQGFCPQNNFYYCPGCHFEPSFDKGDYDEYPARATGNDHFDNHPGINDWYETVKLNYGVDYWTRFGHFSPVPDTWDKMVEILLFWASKGIDGFRCDMAEIVGWKKVIDLEEATYRVLWRDYSFNWYKIINKEDFDLTKLMEMGERINKECEEENYGKNHG